MLLAECCICSHCCRPSASERKDGLSGDVKGSRLAAEPVRGKDVSRTCVPALPLALMQAQWQA